MPIFASFFEFCLFLVLLRDYLATYYPNFLVSCSYECIRAFSFLEIQVNKYITRNKIENYTSASNICDFEFLLVEHEQDSGEFIKIDIPKHAYYEGNVLDYNFFNKILGLQVTEKYKLRILDHNVNYLHIDNSHKIILFKDYYLLESSAVEEDENVQKIQEGNNNGNDKEKECDKKQKEDSDGFEEFTDMNFH